MRHITRLVVLGLVGVVGIIGMQTTAANAQTPDGINGVKSDVLGYTAKNLDTHVWTTIIDTWEWTKPNGTTVSGPRISAQHCKSDGCWGGVVEGNLKTPYVSLSDTNVQYAQNYCFANANCAAAWNWPNAAVDNFSAAVSSKVAQPCVKGALGGAAATATHDIGASAMAEGLVISAGKTFGGVAVGSCLIGIGIGNLDTAAKVASALNPFNKTGRHHR